jgi:ferrochelatase
MNERRRVGVVLFQLGGPDRLSAVQPFLFNLFSDPDIFDFPFAWLARRPLAWLISGTRARHVREHYAAIGGGSPIREQTEGQALALAEALEPHLDVAVVIAMRYWKPTTAEAVRRLARLRLDELVLLPLYPQYSRTTTGSSLREWRRRARPLGLPEHVIDHFYDHPLYLSAVVERIEQALAEFRRPAEVHLVFSAHGLPISVIAAGDPYQKQVEETVRLVMEQGGWGNPHWLCYQSRVGPQKWLEPSLTDLLERLARQGVKSVLVVPISFVSDHIETLYEINLEARALATSHGIEEFAMMRSLGNSPRFIAALADLVLGAVSSRETLSVSLNSLSSD